MIYFLFVSFCCLCDLFRDISLLIYVIFSLIKRLFCPKCTLPFSVNTYNSFSFSKFSLKFKIITIKLWKGTFWLKMMTHHQTLRSWWLLSFYCPVIIFCTHYVCIQPLPFLSMFFFLQKCVTIYKCIIAKNCCKVFNVDTGFLPQFSASCWSNSLECSFWFQLLLFY